MDPDDLIRDDRERWAKLVEEAQPVVDFYLDLLMEDLDLNDTKAKARVVDTLLPVLRALANPVERGDYVQKIARALRIDDRAVSSRLRSPRHRSTRRKGQARPTATSPTVELGPADLEGYCLSLLLERPHLLDHANQMLVERELEPVGGADFAKASYRMAFEALSDILGSGSITPVQDLRVQLPDDITAAIGALETRDRALVADEQLARDAVRTILRIRQERLRQVGLDLRLLQVESREAGDARAAQYDEAQLAFSRVLLRTQRALSRLSIG
jgi:DNA primase